MESIASLAQMIVAFLAILTVLVFVHEWGHYIIARINGVRVQVFSIGFGPEIWGFNDKNGTRWKFSWIPLGGYVKFYGDASEASTPSEELEYMSEEEKKVSFHFKSLPQKAAIVFAGPAVNFIFAVFILAGLYFAYGKIEVPPVVGEVLEDGAANKAGILAGDRIVNIDGEEINSFSEIREHLYFKTDADLVVVVERNGVQVPLTFAAQYVENKDMLGNEYKMPQIGIKSVPGEIEVIEFGIVEATWQAILKTKNITERNLQGLKQMIVGDRSVKELGGPISIARVAGKTAEFGIVSLIELAALISISLGMINLFPIPMLDGGHLLYYAIEGVMGRKMSPQAQEFGFKVGFLLVIGLMVFATFNDISKI